MDRRHTQADIERWDRDGAVLTERFLRADEVSAVAGDCLALYGEHLGDTRSRAAVDLKQPGDIGQFNPQQFLHFHDMPFTASPAINLAGLHPALIAFALGCAADPGGMTLPKPFLGEVHGGYGLRPDIS